MLTLLDLQGAMRSRLLDDDGPMPAAILAEVLPPDRLSIYRNTSRRTLTNTLRLAYPAVLRLVGEDFFVAAADAFIAGEPPHTGWLDLYGAAFPYFLNGFAPARTLSYLSDVARLEWTIVRAAHAADAAPLAPAQLAALAASDHARLRFVPHPSIGLLASRYPVDAIWRAVLARDDGALAAIDLSSGPVWLLIDGRANIEVTRLDEQRWQFAATLLAGQILSAAIEGIDNPDDAAPWLAEHLAAGHFAGFALSGTERTPSETGPREAGRARHDRIGSIDVAGCIARCGGQHDRVGISTARPRSLRRSRHTAARRGRHGVLEFRDGEARRLECHAVSFCGRVPRAAAAAGARCQSGACDRADGAGAARSRPAHPPGRACSPRHDRGDRNLRLSAGVADPHSMGGDAVDPALPRRWCLLARSSGGARSAAVLCQSAVTKI
jgi:hypothetical protein